MNDFHPDIELKRISRVENEPFLSLEFVISFGEKNEKRVLIIPDVKYVELKLRRGSVTPECFEIVENEAKVFAAYRRGAGILGYGANSGKMLVRKLKQRGFDEYTATVATEKLTSDGYINESNDACREAEACIRKLWGEKRIIAKLYEKGYGEQALAEAREKLKQTDFTQVCKKFVEKKCKSMPKEKREQDKLIGALSRNGFTLTQIRDALNSIVKE